VCVCVGGSQLKHCAVHVLFGTSLQAEMPDNMAADGTALGWQQRTGQQQTHLTCAAHCHALTCAFPGLHVTPRSSASVQNTLSAFKSAATVSVSMCCADVISCRH
jgi:hypothetical protein